MTDREKAICSRVKEFRERIKWSQPDFAKEIGISRDQLANIEYGRVPLRHGLAVMLHSVFEISGQWLVAGTGPMIETEPAPWLEDKSLYTAMSLMAPLSELFDKNPASFQVNRKNPSWLVEKATPGFDPEGYLFKQIWTWFHQYQFVSPLEAENFAKDIAQYGDTVLRIWRERMAATRATKSEKGLPFIPKRALLSQGEQCKPFLDNYMGMPDDSPVQNNIRDLKELIDHLKKITAPRGAKAALAREFKVTRQAVNAWLSGESAPSADIAIRLTNWKPKSPAK